MAISVIIPAAPMEELLWRLELVLKGLTVQTLAPTEVIVVDSVGQGDDPVSRVVAKFADKLPIRSYQMPPSSHGNIFRAGEARNYGVSQLRVSVPRYLFIDADCVPEHPLLALHDSFGGREISVACSRVHIDPATLSERTLEAIRQTRPCKLDPRNKQSDAYGTHFCAWSCVLSVPAALFAKVGGFWDRMVIEEDIDLGLRLRNAGGRVRYFHRPGAFHLDHPDWRPLAIWEQQVRGREARNELPVWAFTYQQSAALSGYLREPLEYVAGHHTTNQD